MIIYTNQTSKKKSKNTAKKRELQASWQALLEKWDVKPDSKKVNKKQLYSGNTVPSERSTSHIPSVDTGIGVAAKKEVLMYTGDEMFGIGQLHKSNAVPIFKQEDAEDLAKMRR